MVDKSQLITGSRLPTGEVEVPGIGMVTVRGLSRFEVVRLGELGRKEDFDGAETWTLACGMVDPALSEHEVRDWRKAACPGELDAVLEKITELSGLNDNALKEASKSTGV